MYKKRAHHCNYCRWIILYAREGAYNIINFKKMYKKYIKNVF